MSLVRAVTTRALDAAFPAICPGCGREGTPICQECRPALDARLDQPPGVSIGMPFDLPAGLLQLEWCAPFAGVVRHSLHALKYKGERRLAGPLGSAVARRWARAGAGGDLVVHVPVHATRARRRGFDQARLIAEVAARDLGLPHGSILERHRETIAQFDLDRRQRSSNVRGAFRLVGSSRALRDTPGAPAGSREAAGHRPVLAARWILLVDDVMTTGATLSACATVLLDAGAMGVSAITVARER